MSRPRFTVLMVLLAVVVAATAFLGGLSLFDDGEPDPPPRRAADRDGASTTTAAPPAGSETTAAAPVTSGPAGQLPSPSWIVVVSSEGDEGAAQAVADQVAGQGHDAGVLRSDDYPSMNPGFWVAYTGPYPGAGAAEEAEGALAEGGWPNAYARCAGTTEDCS